MRAALMMAALLMGCARDTRGGADSPAAAAEADTLWLFASDPARDAVHASDTEADLIRRFGAANVKRDTISVGEGEVAKGHLLFSGDSLRAMEVLWEDAENFRQPRYAGVSGSTSRWVAYPGVTLGTCFEDIERINGGAFTLYGFDFDYGGTIDGWGKGRLDSLWNTSAGEKVVWVRFERGKVPPNAQAASGERVFSSTDPIMRASNPCVRELFIRPR